MPASVKASSTENANGRDHNPHDGGIGRQHDEARHRGHEHDGADRQHHAVVITLNLDEGCHGVVHDRARCNARAVVVRVRIAKSTGSARHRPRGTVCLDAR